MPAKIRSFLPNLEGDDYICADLHGMYSALMTSLDDAAFSPARDRLFCTGDLIDRGPESAECLQLPKAAWFFSVRGNHEQMMIDALLDEDPSMELMWTLNGGGWHFEQNKALLLQSCRELLDLLPLAFEVQLPDGRRLGICHACCPAPSWAQLEAAIERPEVVRDLLWSRNRLQRGYADLVSGIDLVVCGHTIVTSPRRLGNHLFIDTGAFMTGTVPLWRLSKLIDHP